MHGHDTGPPYHCHSDPAQRKTNAPHKKLDSGDRWEAPESSKSRPNINASKLDS
jgi:hypothetical protein